MHPFWILDTTRYLHIIHAANKEVATLKFNDGHYRGDLLKQITADFCFPAQQAPDGRYIKPNVPVWMEYTLAMPGMRLAPNTAGTWLPDEYGEPEYQQVSIIEPTFFTHSKNAIV